MDVLPRFTHYYFHLSYCFESWMNLILFLRCYESPTLQLVGTQFCVDSWSFCGLPFVLKITWILFVALFAFYLFTKEILLRLIQSKFLCACDYIRRHFFHFLHMSTRSNFFMLDMPGTQHFHLSFGTNNWPETGNTNARFIYSFCHYLINNKYKSMQWIDGCTQCVSCSSYSKFVY